MELAQLFILVMIASGVLVIALAVDQIAKLLKKYLTPVPPPTVDTKWSASEISFLSHKLKIGGFITMVQAKVDQKFGVTWPSPKDKYGNDTQVENVTFSSDDESIATIEPDPDNGPYAAIVRTHETTGATAVRIKADPKVGEEVGEIEGMLAVEVVPGEALAFGEPTNTTPVDDDDEN